MTIYRTILETDEGVVQNTAVYSKLYSVVDKFVRDNRLLERKRGSKLSYWINIACEGDELRPEYGYYFETKIGDDLVEHITKSVVDRFGKYTEKLIIDNCKFHVELGV